MTVQESLSAFRKSPWFRVLYVAILGLVVAALFPLTVGTNVCLALFVVPLTMFVIPYWLGERKTRHFIVNGLVIFAVAVFIVAVLQTQAVLSGPEVTQTIQGPGLDPSMSLANGTVTPFRTESPADFTFRVQLRTVENGTPSEFSVWVNLTSVEGLSAVPQDLLMSPEFGSGNNTANGTWYRVTTQLGSSVYFFFFSAENPAGNWTRTDFLVAPLTVSAGSYFVLFLVISAQALAFVTLFYFIILFLWTFSSRMRRAREEVVSRRSAAEDRRKEVDSGVSDRARAERVAGFTCTNCGADVSEDDPSCPKCGASFED